MMEIELLQEILVELKEISFCLGVLLGLALATLFGVAIGFPWNRK